MKKAFSIILSILLFFVLYTTLTYNAVIHNVNKSSVLNIAINAISVAKNDSINEETGLFYPENKIIKEADFDISKINNTKIEELLNEVLNANDVVISNELSKKIINDSKTKELLGDCTDELFDFLSGKSESINISSKKLKDVIDNSISLYEEETGEKVDYNISEEEIDSILQDAEDGLKELKNKNSEIIIAYNLFTKVFSPVILMFFIGIIVVLFFVIFAINRNIFTAFAYVSVPGIVAGVFVFITGLLGEYIVGDIPLFFDTKYKDVFDALMNMIKGIFVTCNWSGIITIVAGIVLCILGFGFKEKPAVSK